MPRCAWLFCLFLLFPLASTSFALDMTWSTGSKDISVQSAKPCTLVVGTLGGTETLPGGWRLIWTALTGETEPITLLTGVAAEDAANVCRVATAPSAEYLISRVDTAAFCSGDSFARATVARFFLKIPAGAVGKIKLLPENMVAMDSLAALRVESLPEVTINGGLSMCRACQTAPTPAGDTGYASRMSRASRLSFPNRPRCGFGLQEQWDGGIPRWVGIMTRM